MTVKQCNLDALIKRMWQQVEVKGYAELNPDDVSSLAALKAERDSLKRKMELINGLIGVSERANTLAEQRLDELNKQVVNLAVENAAMKKFCKNAAFDADYEADLAMERGGFTDALNDIQTPATDAAIANIQAQGVEKFAEYPALGIIACSHIALEFAQQLRTGEVK